MKMEEGKCFVGNTVGGDLTNALEARNREIRVISPLFVYHPAMVVAEELGTIGGVATRTAI